MANLPRAVQRQVEAADAIVAQISKPADPTPAQPEAAAQDAQAEPQNTPPVEVDEQPVQPPAPPQQPTVDWEHKFKTLQGLFNAEVPKLQTQVKTLTAQLQEVLEKQEKQQPGPVAEQPKAPTHDKDVDDFGADLVEMIHRQIAAQLGAVSAKIDGMFKPVMDRMLKIEQTIEGTSSTVAATAEEVFFDRLTKAVPDWENLNVDQGFLAWLAEVDPVYGQPRQAALHAARSNLDVARVSAVFNAYKATLPKQPKVDTLSKQISPKPGASTPAPQQQEKPTITQKSIQDFYHQVATGKYRGREKEAAEIETMINLAIAEGRVV